MNFQMFKLALEKSREPEIKLPTSAGSLKKQESSRKTYISDLETGKEREIKLSTSAGPWKKQESSRKTSISALLTMPKPLTERITKNSEKF